MASRLNPYISYAATARQAVECYKGVLGGELALNTYGESGMGGGSDGDKIMHAREHRRPGWRPRRHVRPRTDHGRRRTPASGAAVVTSREVLVPNGAGRQPTEQIDVSVTHWSGQYVPESAWPRFCGPDGYTDPPVADAPGKDCDVFHGDYTGLAVGSDDAINVVWTGLNRFATSPPIDPCTGRPHDGYAQDAMFARR